MSDNEKTIVKDALCLLNDALAGLAVIESANPMALIIIKIVQGVVKSTELMV